MIPTAFAYVAARSVDEAVSLLKEHGDEAKLLAGGHSLLPMMKLRLAAPSILIDIGRIKGLSGIALSGIARHNGTLSICAASTHSTIEHSAELRDHCPLLAETAAKIGDRQVRNRGTIGGSLAHADPAADLPAAVLALGATLLARSADGERTIAADDFFVDLLTTALAPGEMLTEIRVPSVQHAGTAYVKFANPASGYALVGVAASLELDSSGRCQGARVAITGAGSKATRAGAVEAALAGQAFDETTAGRAAVHAAEGIDLLSDIHGSAEYRGHLCRVLTRRAILTAAQRARGATRS